MLPPAATMSIAIFDCWTTAQPMAVHSAINASGISAREGRVTPGSVIRPSIAARRVARDRIPDAQVVAGLWWRSVRADTGPCVLLQRSLDERPRSRGRRPRLLGPQPPAQRVGARW